MTDLTNNFAYDDEVLEAVREMTPDTHEWKLSAMENSGHWIWEHVDGSDVWVYATPWCEGHEFAIGISVCTETHDDGLFFDSLAFAPRGPSVKADARRYLAAMTVFLAKFGPRV